MEQMSERIQHAQGSGRDRNTKEQEVETTVNSVCVTQHKQEQTDNAPDRKGIDPGLETEHKPRKHKETQRTQVRATHNLGENTSCIL